MEKQSKIQEQDSLQTKQNTAESADPWRCAECGSLEVSYKAWVDSNTKEVITDADDGDDEWCDGCEEHTNQIRESELMRDTVEPWWERGTTTEEREAITGLTQENFSSKDGCKAFRDACNIWWNGKTNDEKIGIWRQATAPEDEEPEECETYE